MAKTVEMLDTYEYGRIRIVDRSEVNSKFDTHLGFDIIGEWEFWQIHDMDIDKDNEIVAIYIGDE